MIEWDKMKSGRMIGCINNDIIYSHREDGRMDVWSETNLKDGRVKFSFKPKKK